ncbi:MAG: hypothetical protein ACJAYF_002333 [Arenicella sp.]|jgi:hypothetical protein
MLKTTPQFLAFRPRSNSELASIMSLPSLEVHVPISPTPHFFNMLQCFALSLRSFGGAYCDAPIIVSVGDATIDEGIQDRLAWLDQLGIEVRWIEANIFAQESWFATGVERYRYRFKSDVVLILDCDVFVNDGFEDMVKRVHDEQCFAGLIAHHSPFQYDFDQQMTLWRSVFQQTGVTFPSTLYPYTGYSKTLEKEDRFYSPAYFNFGVQCAPASLMNQIGDIFYEYMHQVDRFLATDKEAELQFFRCQITLAIVLEKLRLPTWALPARFNFPVDRNFEQLHREETDKIKLVHALGDTLNKNHIFNNTDRLKEASQRTDLTGANKVLADIFAHVVDDIQSVY